MKGRITIKVNLIKVVPTHLRIATDIEQHIFIHTDHTGVDLVMLLMNV